MGWGGESFNSKRLMTSLPSGPGCGPKAPSSWLFAVELYGTAEREEQEAIYNPENFAMLLNCFDLIFASFLK